MSFRKSFGRRADGEPVCSWHWTNDNEDRFGRKGSPLKSGRAWFHWYGRKPAIDRAPCAGFEWHFGRRGAGVTLDIGGERDLALGISLGLASFWLTLEDLVPYPRLPRDQACVFDLSWHHGGLWWKCGQKEFEWCNQDPWWKDGHFDPADFFLGRHHVTTQELSRHAAEVPLPEGVYPAEVIFEEMTWKRPRWPRPFRRVSATVELEQPVPFPGKGENGWDCGMDGISSLSCDARSVAAAVAAVVERVLAYRRERGWRAEDLEAAR